MVASYQGSFRDYRNLRRFLFLLFMCLVVSSTRAAHGFAPLTRTLRGNVRHHTANQPKQPPLHHTLLLTTATRGGAGSSSSATKMLPQLGGFTGAAASLVDYSTNPFWKANLIHLGADAIGFLISIATGSHVHLDLIGSGAFALAALPALLGSISTQQSSSLLSLSTQWSGLAVAIWGTKLATFLCFRATKVGNDKRLEDMLSSTSGAFSFWFFTLVWQAISSLPFTLGMTGAATATATATTPLSVKLGAIVYVTGLVIETLADIQKYMFKQSNPGKFCNVGLWKYSQHPNFFGNLLIWTGILLLNVPVLVDPAPAATSMSIWDRIWRYRRLALAICSPLFLWNFFSGQAKGSVTNAVDAAKAKYGSDPSYESYLQDVPLIIPNFVRSFSSTTSSK